MDLTVQIEGLDKLGASAQKVQNAVRDEMRIGLYSSGNEVVAEAVKSIKGGGKTGRIYKRRSVFHQASSPGQSPAADTGTLDRSIRAELSATDLSVKVVALAVPKNGKINYAYELEFGNSRIAPRPFFQPALEKKRAWIKARLQEAFRRGISRGTS